MKCKNYDRRNKTWAKTIKKLKKEARSARAVRAAKAVRCAFAVRAVKAAKAEWNTESKKFEKNFRCTKYCNGALDYKCCRIYQHYVNYRRLNGNPDYV